MLILLPKSIIFQNRTLPGNYQFTALGIFMDRMQLLLVAEACLKDQLVFVILTVPVPMFKGTGIITVTVQRPTICELSKFYSATFTTVSGIVILMHCSCVDGQKHFAEMKKKTPGNGTA